MAGSRDYIPPLSFHSLTRVYDPLIRWVMREEALKRALLDQARISAGMRVLDVGCGTGTLTVMTKQAQPGASVVGLDPDPAALAAARAKSSGQDIRWEQAMAQEMPFPDRSFDRVLASLMLHHLDRATKLAALREMHRVLRPDGRLLILDFTVPGGRIARVQGWIMHRLEHADDNIAGRLPDLIQQSGFRRPTETARFATIFGDVAILTAEPA